MPAPTINFEEVAERLKLVADPSRLAIVALLASGSFSTSDIAAGMDQSASNLARHVALLRLGGLIKSDRDGKQITYMLTARGHAAWELIEKGML